jgi:succinate dehydrogenase / fumarate reductase, cytochrome b subunit
MTTSTAPQKHPRPLSPHLQIYRPQMTSMMSIAHRITGVGLAMGLILLTWFLVALADGPDSFASFTAFCASWFGTLMLMGWSLAISFHLCSGVRHLFFDTGSFFEIRHAQMAGYIVLAGCMTLTTIIWIAAF